MLEMEVEAVKEGVSGGNLYVLRVEATGFVDRSIGELGKERGEG